MRKRITKTLTTISTFLLVVTASAVATEGFTLTQDDNTGIVVENDFSFEEKETNAPEIEPMSDDPDYPKQETPLS